MGFEFEISIFHDNCYLFYLSLRRGMQDSEEIWDLQLFIELFNCLVRKFHRKSQFRCRCLIVSYGHQEQEKLHLSFLLAPHVTLSICSPRIISSRAPFSSFGINNQILMSQSYNVRIHMEISLHGLFCFSQEDVNTCFFYQKKALQDVKRERRDFIFGVLNKTIFVFFLPSFSNCVRVFVNCLGLISDCQFILFG